MKPYFEEKTFEKEDLTHTPLDTGEYEQCTFLNCDFSNGDLSNTTFYKCNFILLNVIEALQNLKSPPSMKLILRTARCWDFTLMIAIISYLPSTLIIAFSIFPPSIKI